MAKIIQFTHRNGDDPSDDYEVLEQLQSILDTDLKGKKVISFAIIPERMEVVRQIIIGFRKILQDCLAEYKIEAEFEELVPTSVGITITTNMFVVDDIPEFCDLIKGAQNIEFDSLRNGKTQISMIVRNVSKPITE